MRATGGFLLLLALLRWQEPAARTLAALAFVPQTFSSYDSLLVFLVAKDETRVTRAGRLYDDCDGCYWLCRNRFDVCGNGASLCPAARRAGLSSRRRDNSAQTAPASTLAWPNG